MEATPIKINNNRYKVGAFTVTNTSTCWLISFESQEWAVAWSLSAALDKAQAFDRDMTSYNAKHGVTA